MVWETLGSSNPKDKPPAGIPIKPTGLIQVLQEEQLSQLEAGGMGIPSHHPSQVTVAGDPMAIPGEVDTPVVTPPGRGDNPSPAVDRRDTHGDSHLWGHQGTTAWQQPVTQPRISSASQASSSRIPSATPTFPGEHTRESWEWGVRTVREEDGGAELWEATWEERRAGATHSDSPVTAWSGAGTNS